MKAILLEGINQPVDLSDFPQPEPQAGEVLVQLKAAALNHRDIWIQKGMYAGLKFPVVLGSDGAGIVTAVGEGVSDSWINEAVIMDPGLSWGDNQAVQSREYSILGMPTNGTFAEYVCIPATNIYKKPAHLSFEEAAALPLAGVTAWRALISRSGLKAGEKCLITGTGGGVAQFALQFALKTGAKVWVTSGSAEKIQTAIDLGAEGGANYKDEDWPTTLKGAARNFDVIIDSAGGDGFGHLVKLAAPGGRIAFYGGTRGKFPPLSPQLIFWKQISILGTTMGSPADFSDMIDFVNKTQLVPVVDEVFPLAQTTAAVEKMKNGQQFGKIVISISD